MASHAMHPSGKGGDDGDQVLDQLFLHRTGRLLVDRRDLGAVALKVAREIREAEPRKPIGIGNDNLAHLFLLNEAAQPLQPASPRIETTAHVLENIIGFQVVFLTELFRRSDLPGEVAILFLVMGGNAAVNGDLGLSWWCGERILGSQDLFNLEEGDPPVSARSPIALDLPGSIPPPDRFSAHAKPHGSFPNPIKDDHVSS